MKFLLRVVLLVFVWSSLATTAFAVSEDEKESIRSASPWYSVATAVCASSTGGGLAENKYALPANHGFTGYEEPINELGQVPSTGHPVSLAQFAKLGQNYRDYYITMRWTSFKWFWNGGAVLADAQQRDWMSAAPRMVLVTNPRTKKSIIAVALESGPAPWTGVDTFPNNDAKGSWQQPQLGTPNDYQGRVAGFPPKAIEALGALQRTGGKQDGDDLLYAWAPEGSAPGPTNLAIANSATNNCGPAGGVGVSPDGFVFPLQISKAYMTNNVYWGEKCKNPVSQMGPNPPIAEPLSDSAMTARGYRRSDLCHHDYLAADMQAPVGTKALAPRPGRIIRSGQSSDPCISHNVSLYSDKALGGDGNTYYFAHLSAASQAKVGDVVQAGAIIGTVDDGHGCFQSHLHMDVSPIQTPFSRRSFGTCGPLLDPQPALIAAYNNLP